MNALKEIRVTESYLGLDQKDRNCQHEKPLNNCTSRQYIDTFLGQCGCLPFNIKQFAKVYFHVHTNVREDIQMFINYILGKSLHLITRAGLCEQCEG